jgi:hypothetical protein
MYRFFGRYSHKLKQISLQGIKKMSKKPWTQGVENHLILRRKHQERQILAQTN